jgi:hypothetical protein
VKVGLDQARFNFYRRQPDGSLERFDELLVDAYA